MARMIDGNKLVENPRLIATCWSISPFVSKEKHNGAVDMLREVEKEVKEAPTLTQLIIGYYCSQWSDPENGYKRYTSPNDYCSYFEPKEALKDGL